jgi:hypothetical protein
MSRSGKLSLVLAVGVVVVILLMIFKPNFLSYGVRFMSVHDRVTDVVQVWGHMQAIPDDKQELEVIWDKSGLQFEFYPYAVQDLTEKLTKEFRDSDKPVLRFTDVYADANKNGKIKTVEQLATAVRQNYQPH